jgi:transcriptional regulator
MYMPNSDRVTDPAKLHQFMRENSFATIISVADGRIGATRVPLMLDPALGPNGTLIGHIARANPQWRSFDGDAEAMAAFDGPHAYISPNWYVTAPAVPTWNYATVHAYGRPRIIEDTARLAAIVDELVSIYERGMPEPWPEPGQLPEDFKHKLLGAIVGFEMRIERIEGKFKFGKNRPANDQMSMIQHLERSGFAAARGLAVMMKRELP